MLRDVHRRGAAGGEEANGVRAGINDDAAFFKVRQDLLEPRWVECWSDLLASFGAERSMRRRLPASGITERSSSMSSGTACFSW